MADAPSARGQGAGAAAAREPDARSQLAERLGDLAELPQPDREQPAPAAGAAADQARADLPARPAGLRRGRTTRALAADLLEVFGDPLFEGTALTTADLRELVVDVARPSARAVLTLYQRVPRRARVAWQTLAAQLLAGDEDVAVGRRAPALGGGERPHPAPA